MVLSSQLTAIARVHPVECRLNAKWLPTIRPSQMTDCEPIGRLLPSTSTITILLCTVIGAIRQTCPITNSFVQFAELHLSTVVNCSLANWTHESLIGAVHCTKPSGI